MSKFRETQFTLRHQLIAFLSTRLFANYTYTIRHGLAAGMRRRGGLGFLPVGGSETAEDQFLRSLDYTGKNLYDIGAFEGCLTLFFAKRAASVTTYEPNPRNYSRCVTNVRLNGLDNVQLLNRGISSEPGELELTYDPLMPGAGSGNTDISHQISSSVSSAVTVRVPIATLDQEIENQKLPKPDFVKIDIEGMELNALQGMQQTLRTWHPALYIELHGAEFDQKISNAKAVLSLIEGEGYRIFDVENQRFVTSPDFGSKAPSHIYCTHESVPT